MLCLAHSTLPHPPSCPAFPRRGFALRAFRGLRRCGTMRALTPVALSQARQVSPVHPLAVQTSHPQPRRAAPTSRAYHLVRPMTLADQASPQMSRLAATHRRIGFVHPAGCPFASGCSPPRLTATQLPSATCAVTSHDTDSHRAGQTDYSDALIAGLDPAIPSSFSRAERWITGSSPNTVQLTIY